MATKQKPQVDGLITGKRREKIKTLLKSSLADCGRTSESEHVLKEHLNTLVNAKGLWDGIEKEDAAKALVEAYVMNYDELRKQQDNAPNSYHWARASAVLILQGEEPLPPPGENDPADLDAIDEDVHEENVAVPQDAGDDRGNKKPTPKASNGKKKPDPEPGETKSDETPAPEAEDDPHDEPAPTATLDMPESFGLHIAGNPSRLAAKIALATASMSRVKQSKVMENKNFKYSTLDDILDVVRPALAAQGIAFLSSLLDAQKRQVGQTKHGNAIFRAQVTMRYFFIDSEDGATLAVDWIGEADDSGDKVVNKGSLFALKYFFRSTFMLSTGDEE